VFYFRLSFYFYTIIDFSDVLILFVHLLVTSVMYSHLSFICTLVSDISDVLMIFIYVYTY